MGGQSEKGAGGSASDKDHKFAHQNGGVIDQESTLSVIMYSLFPTRSQHDSPFGMDFKPWPAYGFMTGHLQRGHKQRLQRGHVLKVQVCDTFFRGGTARECYDTLGATVFSR